LLPGGTRGLLLDAGALERGAIDEPELDAAGQLKPGFNLQVQVKIRPGEEVRVVLTQELHRGTLGGQGYVVEEHLVHLLQILKLGLADLAGEPKAQALHPQVLDKVGFFHLFVFLIIVKLLVDVAIGTVLVQDVLFAVILLFTVKGH